MGPHYSSIAVLNSRDNYGFHKNTPKNHNLKIILTPKQAMYCIIIYLLKQPMHILKIELQIIKISETTKFLFACLSACLLPACPP